MAVVANVMIGVVAFFHVWFFVLERFIWNMPLGQKIFKMSAEKAAAGALLAANQGVYNLVLALGLIWSLLAANSNQATPVKFVLLTTIILVGIYGGVTVGKNVFYMQVIPAVIALLATIAAISAPKINDISTSFSQPPQFRAIAAALPGQDFKYPAEFAADQQNYFDSVLPLVLPMAPQQSFALVESVLGQFPEWQIVNRDPAAMIIEGSETTQFMRFTDDFVIEVRPGPGGSEVHMRSRSRVGKSDFGVNAARITKFLTKVQAAFRKPG